MKNFLKTARLVCFLAFTIGPVLVAFQKTSVKNPPEDTLGYLIRNFSEPGKQYGTAPLWVWNTTVTKADIDSMLYLFKEQAFGGVFVHPRPSLVTEYLSPEWNELYTYTVKKGKELGLDIWIYDENSYPSGFGGGHVPDQMPESYNQGQMLAMTEVNLLPDTAGQFFLCLKDKNGVLTDITKNVASEKGKTGKYYLFKKNFYKKNDWTAGFPYVDLMVKGVTEKFIDVTMSGYEKNFGSEFGKTVPGIFTDEPTIHSQISKNIRWTPDLFSSFKQKWGYDLQTSLPSLFEEVGEWKKVRHNYYQTLLQLYIDRWSKPYSSYAAKKGLIWTGHYYEHNWPNPIHGPDHMAMYAWHQRPGIDMLFNEFNEKGYGTLRETQFGNVRAVKELASVANQLNKDRTLCEAYAGGGWEITLKELKRLGDWQYALGVNFVSQHLAHMSINGSRKYDYPQSFSYHNPWFAYYKEQNQYYKRLSFVLSKGEQRNDILILEPTTSAWMYTFNGGKNKRLTEITKAFPSFVVSLEKAQVEYDLGSENIIKDHGKLSNGKFVIGERSYSTVVLPPGMENIDSPTFKLLKEFADKGGRVLQFEKLRYLDGKEDAAVSSVNISKSTSFFKNLDKNVIRNHFKSPGFSISALPSDSVGGNLFHNRRQFSDGQLLFLANSSLDDYSKGKVEISGADALVMDLFTGEVSDYPEVVRNGVVSLEFKIAPAGSLLLFISSKKQTGFKRSAAPLPEKVLNSTVSSVMRPQVNSLVLDFCDVTLGNNQLKDLYVFNAADTVFKHHGFTDGNPWDHKVQFKTALLDKNPTYKPNTGFTATYHFNIKKDFDFSGFKAVIEQAELYKEVTINGHVIQSQKGKWWLDKSFAVFEIGKYVKAGENKITYTANPMNVLAEIQPVYILGDFNLTSAPRGWQITAPGSLALGSWKEQGLPMYGGNVVYKKQLTLDKLSARTAVKLTNWKGTIASITVNGKNAGTIAYEPYILDVSRFVKKGNNQIEVNVIGSLKNVLGPFYNSPAQGYVSPGSFRRGEKLSGKDYDTDDYGLIEDFKVVQY